MKPPKFPKSVRVLTRNFTISYDKKIKSHGFCDRALGTITINPDRCVTREQVIRTLWHEIGHAFAWEAGLSSVLSSDGEELFVETFSSLICDLTNGKLKCQTKK